MLQRINMNYKKYIVKPLYLKPMLLMVLALVLNQSQAQDLHYSQFYNSPLNLNPAQTGIFNGDQRFIASFREQWAFVPVPWTTFSASYDYKILPEEEKNIFGVGFNFNYDRQGAARINLSGLNVTGSYSRVLNKSNIVTVGALLGFSSRGFNDRDLTWDKQWDGLVFNEGTGSGENFDLQRVNFLETGIGLNYRLQKDARTKIDLGIGGYHLYEPTANFYNTDDNKLPLHLTLSAIGSVKLIDALDIQLQFLRQYQGVYREMVFGGLAKIYLSKKRGKETQLHAGLGYRTAKSFIPTVAVQFNQWYLSFSYDFDNTELNEILQSNRGGPEIHLRYIITKVKPLQDRKVCPIY